MDKTDTIATLVAIGSSALAVILPDEETRLIAFNALGAVLGGFVGASVNFGSSISPAEQRTAVARRWLTNFATAFVFAPLLTDYLAARFPDFSRTYLAIATGGLLGIAGVIVLCIALPTLIQRLRKSTTSKLP